MSANLPMLVDPFPGNRCQRRRRSPSARSHASAFTLIELLVVIGIIATLIGILMPALSTVKREGRKTVCASNLKQIGNAVVLYTQQYRGRYPRSPSLPSVNPLNLPPVQDRLAPHIAMGASAAQHHIDQGTGVMQVFRCPADEVVFPLEKNSYFYNQELGERPLHETFLFQVYRGDLSRIPVLWDADKYHGGSVPLNWLFVDSHVEPWTSPPVKP